MIASKVVKVLTNRVAAWFIVSPSSRMVAFCGGLTQEYQPRANVPGRRRSNQRQRDAGRRCCVEVGCGGSQISSNQHSRPTYRTSRATAILPTVAETRNK